MDDFIEVSITHQTSAATDVQIPTPWHAPLRSSSCARRTATWKLVETALRRAVLSESVIADLEFGAQPAPRRHRWTTRSLPGLECVDGPALCALCGWVAGRFGSGFRALGKDKGAGHQALRPSAIGARLNGLGESISRRGRIERTEGSLDRSQHAQIDRDCVGKGLDRRLGSSRSRHICPISGQQSCPSKHHMSHVCIYSNRRRRRRETTPSGPTASEALVVGFTSRGSRTLYARTSNRWMDGPGGRIRSAGKSKALCDFVGSVRDAFQPQFQGTLPTSPRSAHIGDKLSEPALALLPLHVLCCLFLFLETW